MRGGEGGHTSAERLVLRTAIGRYPTFSTARLEDLFEVSILVTIALKPSSRSLSPTRVQVAVLPAWDCLPYDRVSPNPDVMAQRLDIRSGSVARRSWVERFYRVGVAGGDCGADARGARRYC